MPARDQEPISRARLAWGQDQAILSLVTSDISVYQVADCTYRCAEGRAGLTEQRKPVVTHPRLLSVKQSSNVLTN